MISFSQSKSQGIGISSECREQVEKFFSFGGGALKKKKKEKDFAL